MAMALTSLSLTSAQAAPATFGDDVDFLRQHTELVVLKDKAGQAQVAVAPAWQGRVMTSTAKGQKGASFGWVNRELIAAGKLQPHINVFGGEDRFWLGPEGGQFALFFAPGVPFDFEHWQTPASLDTEPFQVVTQKTDRVHFRRSIQLTNYSGQSLELEANREVGLVNAIDLLKPLGLPLPRGVKAVAFESVNSVKNTGKRAWTKETGMLSIWILGMFNASPQATIVVPFKKGAEADLGPVVNDSYFGKVPADRLVVKDGVLFFCADAKYRSKIGLSPRRVKPLLGSYDAGSHTLTLVRFSVPEGAADYVNSMWEMQKAPFSGDVLNSYNDGPPQPGAKQMGKFYELESSSPAMALAPGASATHRHQTVHLQGTEKQLEQISQAAFGVSLAKITSVFKK